MTAHKRYLSSIVAAFKSHLQNQSVSFSTSQTAINLLEEFLNSKNNFSVWSSQEFEDFLSSYLAKHPNPTQEFQNGAIQISKFITQTPPFQTSVLLHSFLLALKADGCSRSTIKNYRSDINQFLSFTNKTDVTTAITKPKIASFVRYQRQKGLKDSSIERKIKSLNQFCEWLRIEELIDTKPIDDYRLESVLKAGQDTQDESRTKAKVSLPFAKNIFVGTTASSTPDNNDKQISTQTQEVVSAKIPLQYHLPQPGVRHDQEKRAALKSRLDHFAHRIQVQTKHLLVSYINLALIVVFFIGLGVFGFQQLFSQVDQTLAYPTANVRPNRFLSFQGRLTDAASNPITTATNFDFELYDAVSGGTKLWDSGTCSIDPDADGIFSTDLGEACGSEITEDVFSENSNIWLQVTVAAEILTPRQKIKTVPYALNTETVQGFPVAATESATINTLLVMNEWGEVLLAENSPLLRSVSGTFAIEGQAITLQTTSGSNGDIILSPDGLGEIIGQSYFSAPGATLSATYAGGTALTARGGPTGTANIVSIENSAGTALSVFDEAGYLGIGTSNPLSALQINGGTGSIATGLTFGDGDTGLYETGDDSLVFVTGGGDKLGLVGNLFYDAQSGTSGPAFSLTSATSTTPTLLPYSSDSDTGIGRNTSNTLSLITGGSSRVYIDATGLVGIGTTIPANILDVSGNAGILAQGDLRLYDTDSSNYVALESEGTLAGNRTYTFPYAVTDGYVLQTNSTGTLTWADPTVLAGAATYWSQASGSLFTKNSTVDFFVGGQATTSAKFAVLNVNSGTPTATISGSTAGNALSLTGDGTIATTLNRSLLLNPNGGNVGIGTTAPTHLLQVHDNADTSNRIQITHTGTGIGASNGLLYGLVGDNAQFWNFENGYIQFATNNSEALRIQANGNIGIGTTTANDALEILSTTDAQLRLAYDATSYQAIQVLSDGGTTWSALGTDADLNFDFSGATDGDFSVNTNDLFVDTSTGKVGIGAISPTSQLQVVSTANDVLRIDAGATGSPQFSFYQDTTSKAYIQYQDTGDYLRIADNGSVGIVQNTGQVNIGGDTTPNSLFTVGTTSQFQVNSSGIIAAIDGVAHTIDDVAGDLTLTSNSTNISLNDNVTFAGTTTLNSVAYTWPGADGSSGQVLSTNGGGTLSWTSAAVDSSIHWSSTLGALYPKNSTVDFLIGGQATTSAKFAVLNVNSGTPTASVSAGVAGGAYLTATGNLQTTANQELTLGGTTTGDIILHSDTSDNVGIGTTAPTARLDIASSALNSDVLKLIASDGSRLGRFTETSGGAGWFEVDNATGTAVFLARADGGDSYLSTGQFGIGTTTANAQLDVLATTEQLRLSYNTSSYFSNTIASDGGYSLAGFGTDADYNIDFSGATDGDFSVNTNDIFVDTSTGNVGIGTTVPGYDLQVEGDIAAATGFWLENSGGNFYNSLFIDKTNSEGLGTNGLFLATTGGSEDFRLKVGGSTKFSVLDNGNVGIGSTSPASKLDIQGGYAGNALVTLNETNGNDIFTASASGVTKFRVANNGYTYSERFVDIANSAYYLDPAATADSLLTAGDIGIGTTAAAARIHGIATTEQLRLGYNTSSYWTNTIASDGGYSLAGFGTDADFNFDFSGATDGDFSINTDDLFVDTSSGFVGIGTTTVSALFHTRATNALGESEDDQTLIARFQDTYSGTNQNILDIETRRHTTGVYGNWNNSAIRFEASIDDSATAQSWMEFIHNTTTADNIIAFGEGDGGAGEWMRIDNGNVGIGTTNPANILDVFSTSEQLRLRYDASNYTTFLVDSTGDINISPTGGNFELASGVLLNIGGLTNLGYHAISGTATTSQSLTGDSDLFIEGNFEVDGSVYLDAGVKIGDDTGVPTGGSGFRSDYSSTATTSSNYGKYHYFSAEPASASTGSYWGEVSITDLTTAQDISQLLGSTQYARVIGNATNVSNVINSQLVTNVTTGNTTTIGNIIGLHVQTMDAEDATVTSVEGIRVTTPALDTGTITNGYGIRILEGAVGTYTAYTNQYGVYIPTMDNATNNWAIYSAGGGTDSYHAGNFGIGDSTPTEAQLVLSSDIYVGSFASSGTAALCWDNSGGSLINDCSGSPVADYAEIYPTENNVEYGEIVVLGQNQATIDFIGTDEDGNSLPAETKVIPKLAKSATPYQSEILGVTSRNWSDFSATGHNSVQDSDHPLPVALNGRVPVKVTASNGPISIGDPITSSAIAGTGMKATKSGRIIGRALENYNPSNPNQTGTILVFINTSWFDPDVFLTDNGDLAINNLDNGTYSVTQTNGNIIDRVGRFGQAVIGNITAGMIRTKELIASVEISTPKLLANRVETDLISPIGNEIIFQLDSASDSAKVAIQDDNGNQVAFIDNKGNAGFEGNLAAKQLTATQAAIASVSATTADIQSARISQLEANVAEFKNIKAQTADLVNATVSGTLYADNIANFQDKVEASLKTPSLLSQIMGDQDVATESASIAKLFSVVEEDIVIASGAGTLNKSLADLNLGVEDVTIQAQAVFINNYLEVNGNSYISDSLGVQNRILIGDGLMLASGTIEYQPETGPTVLKIQPSGVGRIELLDGLMALADNGQVQIIGDLSVAGNLTVEDTLLTDLLAPTDFGNPFQVQVAGVSTESGQVEESRFEIINELGTPVATISAQGKAAFAGGINIGAEDVSASGSADVNSTKTSGKALVGAGSSQVTIHTAAASSDSLIYVTPRGSTGNQVLYVKDQQDGRFTVGFDNNTDQNVSFTWWVVN